MWVRPEVTHVNDQNVVKPLRLAALLLLLLPAWPRSATAQPLSFGAADDLREATPQVWWRRGSTITPRAGVSLIGPQWRSVVGIEATVMRGWLDARFEHDFRSGVYGFYEEDADEWYDLARAIRFIRTSAATYPLYARIGPLADMRLGSGQLVEFHHTNTAWESRTVGGELYYQDEQFSAGLFSGDLRGRGVQGAEFTWQPLAGRSERWGSLAVGVQGMTDLSTWGESAVSGLGADLRVAIWRAGTVELAPVATFATLLNHGHGYGTGITLQSDNLADLARFSVKAELFFHSDRFRRGPVGAFYMVSNPYANVVRGDVPASAPPIERFAGVPLELIESGTNFRTEIRFVLFDALTLWYAFNRHYGPQDLSRAHLRVYLRASGGLLFVFGQDRDGLANFGSLFDSLGDLSHLTFRVDYRLYDRLSLSLRARYTYERLADTVEGDARYIVERRFEPTAGFRIEL